MISFPNAKINIGLHVISKRQDGYHNIETIFFPVRIFDALEMIPWNTTEITITGIPVDGDPGDNLILKAYRLLKEKYKLPPVKFHLHKKIPTGAGLGGGSSDAAFALKMINTWFNLGISPEELKKTAAKLGADCPFFIDNIPSFASGIGDKLENIPFDLADNHLIIVKPPVGVNTKDAYKRIKPAIPAFNLKEIVNIPVTEWKNIVVNDFEEPVFQIHPTIAEIKESLYRMGAIYASMSGSGSAVFGIFRHLPAKPEDFLPEGVSVYR